MADEGVDRGPRVAEDAYDMAAEALRHIEALVYKTDVLDGKVDVGFAAMAELLAQHDIKLVRAEESITRILGLLDPKPG